MSAEKLFDAGCRELAEHFFPDAEDEDLNVIAQTLQDTIEEQFTCENNPEDLCMCDVRLRNGKRCLNTMIQVCDKCFRACCWQGIFMCDESKDAGTCYKPLGELMEKALEHPDYWVVIKEARNG